MSYVQDHHRILDLACKAATLVREGKRGNGVRQLLYALQLFYEDRLGEVLPKGLAPDMALDKATVFFETEIVMLGFPEDVQREIVSHGIRFAGELFRYNWHADGKIGDRVRRVIIKAGFSLDFDPWQYGWRPKYLQDPMVREALAASLVTITPLKLWDPLGDWRLHKGPQFIIGELGRVNGLGNHNRWADIASLESRLKKAHPVLHAAMYLPDDLATPEFCAEYNEGVAREERARIFYESFGRPGTWSYHGGVSPPHWEGSQFVIDGRRAEFAKALRAEGMNPHFFMLVVFWGNPVYNKATSVRHLLQGSSRGTSDSDWNMEKCLSNWGLKFNMKKGEFDAIFGPE